uniref:Small ribosomal subunit protein uS10m n=1 Tax=Prototheca wickerhamii TaxID=3111 RepID=RT10_PROWI|nr:ribosomal protein S10 [Prototheca wickerhamii]P46742.1 RecName: Full=Small ribosomal subunit protein uS10m; AltName: Full=Ribosomal protein S10, mitochondrial [Prototheca wickerhamii]AAD12663.1 ribosomal protein S10 [Prototheca wickerhamii]
MQQVQLKLKSFDPVYINQLISLLNDVLDTLEIQNSKEIFLPSKIKKITVIRSPHIHKKSRDQFQIKRYKRSMIISFTNIDILHAFLEICKDLHVVGVQIHISVKYHS